eukprot:CAMPEP_0169437234 /NCGR_PEP_ID=MMETSP1042-20121227/6023_1 /TAXON_ID=464988 /ORGANISM="Hemiselmis andersenii, Strain CCMP1180" /LENGTH=149 /DNA_ID=CAMNT_0009548001 /DNA_START=374 /DNA_END=819 /DNA_ORIENTATION=-
MCLAAPVASLKTSFAHAAATTALVAAMAGMMRFATPWVNFRVTPSIPCSLARFSDVLKSHCMCSASSQSRGTSPNGRARSHSSCLDHSTQWAGVRGTSARVHMGKLTCGGKRGRMHSKQGVVPGDMTLTCPLTPSVPPSTTGMLVPGTT